MNFGENTHNKTNAKSGELEDHTNTHTHTFNTKFFPLDLCKECIGVTDSRGGGGGDHLNPNKEYFYIMHCSTLDSLLYLHSPRTPFPPSPSRTHPPLQPLSQLPLDPVRPRCCAEHNGSFWKQLFIKLSTVHSFFSFHEGEEQKSERSTGPGSPAQHGWTKDGTESKALKNS